MFQHSKPAFPHNDGIAATASVLNTNNWQFLEATLQLIHFIFDQSVLTFNNQHLIQTHTIVMGTKFAPQYANIFMHKVAQDFFASQDLQPMLYTRYIDLSFPWTYVLTCCSDLVGRQTQDTTDRVPFIVQYFPRAEKLRHVLCSLQLVINDDECLAKIIPMPPLLAFKQLPNLKQIIVRSQLPSLQDNVDHNTIKPCHSNLCKTCQIIDMDTTITRGNTTHHILHVEGLHVAPYCSIFAKSSLLSYCDTITLVCQISSLLIL
eukprot:g37280.t1